MSSATTMNGGSSGGGGIGGAGQSKQTRNSSMGKAQDGNRKQQSPGPGDGQIRKQQPQQHRAWQGPNPVTQRASPAHMTNGNSPKPPPHTQNKMGLAETDDGGRLVHVFSNMKGSDATLTLKNGEQFTGVFAGARLSSNSTKHYHMKMVKRTRLPSHQQVNGTASMAEGYVGEGDDHSMVFNVEETSALDVANVTTASSKPAQNGTISMLPTPLPSANALTFPGSAGAFRTDTEISSQREKQMLRERELQPWVPDSSTDFSLELDSDGATGWDQFATNETKYGVQSTYDEDIYTTKIDRSNPAYREREARAARIAGEIETSAPGNAHVAEERRREAAAGDGMDEEEKYSGVQRNMPQLPRGGAGSYVPPSRRPITNAPTVPGAPFDPAIVSLARPAAKASPPAATEIAAQPKRASEAEISPAKATMPSINTAPQAPKKSGDNTAEDHMRAVADSFKQFSNSEKLRLRQLQEQKRVGARHEKNVKLNDLKKFAASFQLKSRVPDDLVPILAKDVEKQQDIQKKAEDAARAAELRAQARGSESSSPAKTTPTNTVPSNHNDPRSLAQGNNRSSQAPSASQSTSGQPPLTREQRIERNTALFNSKMSARQRPQQPQPVPANLRIPKAPAAFTQLQNQLQSQRSSQPHVQPPAPAQDNGPLSPTSATRLNVNAKAFEFRPNPVANTFTPIGNSPSPQRKMSSQQSSKPVATPPKFFKTSKTTSDEASREPDQAADCIARLASEGTEEQRKTPAFKNIGGMPPPYKTAPTWFSPEDRKTSYLDAYPRSRQTSQGTSVMHTPDPNAPMPHSHQLPPHMQGPPMGTPQFAPRHYQPPQHNMQHFGPGMGQFGPNGSVQNSPRFPPAQMAFNNQMQPQMGMPPFPGAPMPGYGMSPSMQYRQMNMPQSNQNMMMQGPLHGSMPPQMRQNFPGQGPPPQQFGGPNMGGQMMVQQPSGGYMGGPMPQQQQAQYSPMPQHPQPHFQGGPPHHMQPGNAPYANSPRPHPMSHQGSHQGYQPQQQQQQQQGGSGMPPMGPMQNGFGAPSPGQHNLPQPHPYHMQQRQMSNQGYTPRGHNAVPMNMQQQQQQQGGYQGGHQGHPGGPSQGGDEGK